MDIPAVLFMNSNKSEQNARKIVAEDRLACCYVGIGWKHEVIVNKGANRDIDREAVNILVSLLVTRQCEVVVVEKLSDLTNDASDLEEFMRDAAQIGVCFYELSSQCFYSCHVIVLIRRRTVLHGMGWWLWMLMGNNCFDYSKRRRRE